MRGDRPPVDYFTKVMPAFTPHARGSTFSRWRSSSTTLVYPACAGIDRNTFLLHIRIYRLPRMRGDRPILLLVTYTILSFTPHARGSTLLAHTSVLFLSVYPACAGIDHTEGFGRTLLEGLPRMRGDRPSKETWRFSWAK